MRRKGLVYRATTLLGLSLIFMQFGGEIIYAKYFREDRDDILNKNNQDEERKNQFEKEDEEHAFDTQKKAGLLDSWQTERKKRLDKIKQSKERPSAPLLEELNEKPGLKEIRMRKLVEKNTENIQKDVKDDYI